MVLVGRRVELLERTRTEIEDLGAAALVAPADVREPDAVERVVDAAMSASATSTCSHNAGGQFTAPAEEISDKGWRAVHRLGVDAVWSMTRRSRRGR